MGSNEIASKPEHGPDRDPGEGAGAERDRVDWGRLLETHRDRLHRMVALRLDERLRGRVDPSDVIQETFLETLRRKAEYNCDPEPMPPFLWLRFLTLQQLQLVHRRNLQTAARDPRREVSLHAGPFPAASSAALAAQLLGHDTRASEAALRAERKLRLLEALETMDAVDREVLVLRHLEQLTNGECARVLGLQESATTKRFIRALKRFKEILSGLPGGASGIRP
jgi:RNA polymerase sigma-70 factor (ECF subfamily)